MTISFCHRSETPRPQAGASKRAVAAWGWFLRFLHVSSSSYFLLRVEFLSDIRIVSLTAYSKSIATILDNYCDFILVGDSMANVLYGQKNTHIIKIQNIIEHSLSVKQGVRKSLMVVDMPIGTYNTNNQAFKNARLIM